MIPQGKLMEHVRSHPFPVVFATLSGAHLYGFPSADSDFDLRGTHLLPLETVVGLDIGRETVEKDGIYDGIEIDLVTHDVAKYFRLMLRRNGYVLEQIFSPLVVYRSSEFEELRRLATGCITKHHAHNYLGFAASKWKLFSKEDAPQVKPLLYVYRVLLTGIHLMKTGRVEANLVTLNEEAKLKHIDDLIAAKTTGPEKCLLDRRDQAFHQQEYDRLTHVLEQAYADSSLPEIASAKPALNDLLVRLRLTERASP